MDWKRDPMMDSLKCETPKGAYMCVRNHADMSVLWLDGVKLGVFGGGSHEKAKEFAKKHFSGEAI